MNNFEKVKGYIGIARKAGYLIIGGDNIKNHKKKLYLVIFDKNSQKNTIKIVENAKKNDIIALQVDNLADLTGIENCKIIGIRNKKISDLVIEIINKE